MAKGGNFEREISKKVSLWITNSKMIDAVWHTSGSGGRATNRKRSKDNVLPKKYDYGDLGPDHLIAYPFFDCFSCELKTGYAKVKKTKDKIVKTMWSIMDMLDSAQKITAFEEFWDQCANDAKESKREPILIVRRLQRQACIALCDDIFNIFVKNHGKPNFKFIICDLEQKYKIIICNLDQFINWSKDINIKKLHFQYTQLIMKRRINI